MKRLSAAQICNWQLIEIPQHTFCTSRMSNYSHNKMAAQVQIIEGILPGDDDGNVEFSGRNVST
jgi:hypothetical protein